MNAFSVSSLNSKYACRAEEIVIERVRGTERIQWKLMKLLLSTIPVVLAMSHGINNEISSLSCNYIA